LLVVAKHPPDIFHIHIVHFLHRAHIAKMDALFEASFSPLAATGKSMSLCGSCNRYMCVSCSSDEGGLLCAVPVPSASPTSPTLSMCFPSCFRRFIPLRPQRLFCPTCNETFGLPQNGTIKVFDGQRCPLDGYELVLFSLGNAAKSLGKSFPICPKCYSHSPFEGLSSMGCDQCLHPTCRHGLARNAVCMCPAAGCAGVMALDPRSRPTWKVCS
jgi:DNA topoisomerase III